MRNLSLTNKLQFFDAQRKICWHISVVHGLCVWKLPHWAGYDITHYNTNLYFSLSEFVIKFHVVLCSTVWFPAAILCLHYMTIQYNTSLLFKHLSSFTAAVLIQAGDIVDVQILFSFCGCDPRLSLKVINKYSYFVHIGFMSTIESYWEHIRDFSL